MRAALARARAVPYVADAVRFGVADYWQVADEAGGDCEDQVLLMRALLWRVEGWPVERLLPTVCETEERVPHAVLTVALDGAEYVLDPRFAEPTTMARLTRRGYSRCARLDAATGGWVALLP